jgi:hypothetical protein
LSVDAVHAIETLELVRFDELKFVGIEGAVVSLDVADVFALTLADCADVFPAASYAFTV